MKTQSEDIQKHMTKEQTTPIELKEKAGEYLSGRVIEKLKQGKKVLLIVTGGSSIAVAIEANKEIKKYPEFLENLTVSLTDERYGPIGHPDSNWAQLKKQGFDLPSANLVEILHGENLENTVSEFNKFLEKALQEAEYKIGLFGVGVDGHTAGILPKSGAVASEDFAYGYDGGKFERVTMTPKAIKELDEAVVFMQGQEKKEMAKKLMNGENSDLSDCPAQVLTKIESKIYND